MCPLLAQPLVSVSYLILGIQPQCKAINRSQDTKRKGIGVLKSYAGKATLGMFVIQCLKPLFFARIDQKHSSRVSFSSLSYAYSLRIAKSSFASILGLLRQPAPAFHNRGCYRLTVSSLDVFET
jgi:hypothetical protein